MDDQEIKVRRPLFDRLVNEEPWDPDVDPARRPDGDREFRPLRTLDREGLKESMRRELELLFNTRGPAPAHRIPIRDWSVIDYGLPDLGTFSAQNPDHRKELGEIMRRAAMLFEPRLHDIRIRLVPEPRRDVSLGAEIDAMVLVDGVSQPMSFAISVLTRDGKVRVDVAPR
jgi:type VI secretion system protein ImpF